MMGPKHFQNHHSSVGHGEEGSPAMSKGATRPQHLHNIRLRAPQCCSTKPDEWLREGSTKQAPSQSQALTWHTSAGSFPSEKSMTQSALYGGGKGS